MILLLGMPSCSSCLQSPHMLGMPSCRPCLQSPHMHGMPSCCPRLPSLRLFTITSQAWCAELQSLFTVTAPVYSHRTCLVCGVAVPVSRTAPLYPHRKCMVCLVVVSVNRHHTWLQSSYLFGMPSCSPCYGSQAPPPPQRKPWPGASATAPPAPSGTLRCRGISLRAISLRDAMWAILEVASDPPVL